VHASGVSTRETGPGGRVGAGRAGPARGSFRAAPGALSRGPQGVGMHAILNVVLEALNIYKFVVVAAAVLSWLIAFNVVNIRNDFVRSIWNLLDGLTTPLLRPIRNFLPNMGGIDISPVILLLGIMLIEQFIILYIYPNVF
jgi:YggT family protein